MIHNNNLIYHNNNNNNNNHNNNNCLKIINLQYKQSIEINYQQEQINKNKLIIQYSHSNNKQVNKQL